MKRVSRFVCSCPYPVAMSLSHDADCVAPTLVAPGASCGGTVAVSLPGSDGVAAAAQSLVVPSAPSRDGIFVQTTDTFVDDFFDRDEPLQGTF